VEYIDERDITIYTDGSSHNGPRRGGIGIRFVTTDEDGIEHIEDYPLPGYDQATNQVMELVAPIEALKAIIRGSAPIQTRSYRRIVVFTDSQYVVNGYESARFKWQADKWMTRDGNPVVHATQWKELLKLAHRTGYPVEFKWIKGHKSSPHNRAVDKLAKKSAATRTGRQVSIAKVRRKKTDRLVAVGSVQMLGQRITIRVIEDAYLRPQGMNRYKYEVVSRTSPFRGYMDLIFSDADIHLSAGHAYHVRFNEDSRAPRVVRLYREVEA
jgi:ribonuclease HI